MKKVLLILIGGLNIINGMSQSNRTGLSDIEVPRASLSIGERDLEADWQLFPGGEKEAVSGRFANMGEKKKAILSFLPIPIMAASADMYFNFKYRDTAGEDRLDQMACGYAFGNDTQLFTNGPSFAAKMLGGGLVWSAASIFSIVTGTNTAVIGYGALVYCAKTFFDWYDQKTGRSTQHTGRFKSLPQTLQEVLMR